MLRVQPGIGQHEHGERKVALPAKEPPQLVAVDLGSRRHVLPARHDASVLVQQEQEARVDEVDVFEHLLDRVPAAI